MRINLVYEINNREYINCVLLERELVRRGHQVKILCKTEDYIFSNEESWTLIPNSYNTANVNHYKYSFNAKNNIIMYPCEQVVNHSLSNDFDYSASNAIKRLPNLCWGQDYYNFIRSLGFCMDKCSITGAVQLDFCRPEFKTFYKSREDISKQFGLPLDKKWFLFVSDFVYASDIMRDILTKKGEKDCATIKNRSQFEHEQCCFLLSWFEQFLKEHSDYLIIYRKHPVEIILPEVSELAKKYANSFFPIAELNIKEWICNCDYVTTWNSTAGIECYAAQKDIYLLRPNEFPSNTGLKDYHFYESYPRIKTYQDLIKYIVNDEHPNLRNYFHITDLYSIDDTPAFIKVADAIEEIIIKKDVEPLEDDYEYQRIRYLRKNKTKLKSFLKKLYQKMYLIFGISDVFSLGNRFAFEDWRDSADNIKMHDIWAKKIDTILEDYFPKTRI